MLGALLSRFLTLGLCLLAGAGLNLYRSAWRPAGDVQVFHGFYVPEAIVSGQPVRWSRAWSKAEVPLCRWTPLRWHVQIVAPPAAGPAGASATVIVNEVPVKRI